MSKPLFGVQPTAPKDEIGRLRFGPFKVPKKVTSLYPDEELTKSLQMAHDVRYAKMSYYSRSGGAEGGHFASVVSKNRKLKALGEAKVNLDENMDAQQLAELTHENSFEEDGWTEPRITMPAIEDRVDWQRSFDKSVRGLFIDFELSDVPRYRLNHLDRMSEWFSTHGAKQGRKESEGPSFLMVDRHQPPQPGSTRCFRSQPSQTSSMLSEVYSPGYTRGLKTPRDLPKIS